MKMYGLSTEIIRTETSSNNTLVLTFKPNLGGEGDNFTPPPPVGIPLITQKQ